MSRGKIYTNIDNDVTQHERDMREKAEILDEDYQKQLRNTDGYQHLGELNPKRVVVTEDHMKYTAKDLRERRAEGKPVISIYTWENEHGEVNHMLCDEDQEALIQGYICANCLGWQESPITMKCLTVNDFTCNYVRNW